MTDTPTFELTLERIALIRRMVIAWNGAETGAPIVHPDAPYGSTDRDDDISNVTGDDDGTDEEHRALGEAMAVFLVNATLKPGRYAYHNTLAKLDPGEVFDVFRDDETGVTPEHITFDVTAEHIALIPRLSLLWDEARDVPGVDPADPYGEGAGVGPLHREMQPVLQIFLRYADLGPGEFKVSAATGRWAPAA